MEKIPFTNLSIDGVPGRTSTAKLRITPKATLALEALIQMCNVSVPTALAFWFVTFLNDGRLFACIHVRQFASMKFPLKRFEPASVRKTIYTGCIQAVANLIELYTFYNLLFGTGMCSASSDAQN